MQTSPMKSVLGMEQRELVADMVNASIIAAEFETYGTNDKAQVELI